MIFRYRKLWWTCLACAVIASVAALWPKPDRYGFLHPLHPDERLELVVDPAGKREYIRTFTFSVPESEVKRRLESKWQFAGPPTGFYIGPGPIGVIFKTLEGDEAVLTDRDPRDPPGVTCDLTIVDTPGWFELQVLAIKGWLHLS